MDDLAPDAPAPEGEPREETDDQSPELGPALDPPLEAPRRYPSTIGGACYLLVLAAAAVGGVLVMKDDWRTGVKWIGGAMIAAAAFRLVLRERDAGMLSVRRRLVDVILLSAVGAALIVLAQTIPNQPPL